MRYTLEGSIVGAENLPANWEVFAQGGIQVGDALGRSRPHQLFYALFVCVARVCCSCVCVYAGSVAAVVLPIKRRKS